MNRCPGVVTGLVTNIDDPEKQARVKVSFRWLRDTHETDWIRIATLMAGSGRGSHFLPEVNDEVLVAFEHGDPTYPYVIGFLWNGKDLPPNDGASPKVRRLQSVAGHVIECDDRPESPHIRIETKDQRIVLLDDQGKKIEVSDAKGNTITINTQSNEITVVSAMNISLTASSGKISLQAATIALEATAELTAKAPMTTVDASGLLTLKGGLIKLN